MIESKSIVAQITFLYYHELEPVIPFYEEILGLERVEDQGWAKIYRVQGDAYVGIVAGDKGLHAPHPDNAVLVTLVVNSAARWYANLMEAGVEMLSGLEDRLEIGIQCFFIKDPGGYTLEIQQFLRPEQIQVFGG
jgi:catechol-2,3-dioxygenase